MRKSEQKYDALIFDMDGVLIDSTFSYPMVIRIAIQWCWRHLLGNIIDCTAFSYDHFYISKTHPAFNDDYDIAWALISIAASRGTKSLKEAFPTPDQWMTILQNFRGDDSVSWVYANFSGAIPRNIVRQLCEEIYFGKNEYFSVNGKAPVLYKGRGLWWREKPLIDAHWKNFSLPVGIFTGRSWKECLLGLKLLGWEDLSRDRIFTLDDGAPKPSPEGLKVLSIRIGAQNPLFFGDTHSDMEAAKRLGKGKFIYVGKPAENLDTYFRDTKTALRELGFIV